ncbi:restriction endonuclease subunit S [Jeotgalibaca ciconiae]|uniref:Restriction endonuclease subunit S n=1 Tax=Jeotgalibaca ciconiae TaxID=2496265 RepID=A0A3Q9BIK9_9LACT|nr:restriction endonuclease subunit S [Jeotgalibaca ciconiae]
MVESFEYGLNSSATEYDGENKYIRITDIDDSSREFIQAGLTSPNTDLEKADNYLLKHGDILFARTGASVGKSYRYHEKDGKVYYAGFLIRARVKSEFDSEFIFQNTLTVSYDNFVRITSQRSGQPGINANEYACFEFFVPSKHEQSQIGKLFRQIDNTIALHQRKLETLKQLKKGFLQKLFPKNQENVPEIRFANFQEEWEQRKLGEITESYSGGTPGAGNKMYYGGNIPFIRSGEINDDKTELFITEEGLNNSSAKMVSKGDILYALYGATSGEVGISKINGAINQAILAIKLKEDDDSYLITQWFKKQKDSIIATYLQGGQGNLSGSIVKELTLQLPIDKNEQQKIGAFFKSLDDTIDLHQNKLEQLRNIKNGLLQKMFI